MKRFITQLILMIVARLLLFVVGVFSFVYTHIKFTARAIRKRDFSVFIHHMGDYYYDLAFADDQKGNVVCRDLFNDWFVRRRAKGRYDYGWPDHTVSHVTGVNYLRGNLTFMGRLLAGILNAIDPLHVQKAAKNNQFNG